MKDKDKVFQTLGDALDFISIFHAATLNRQDVDGEMLTIPASLLIHTIEVIGGQVASAMLLIDEEGYNQHEASADQRLSQISSLLDNPEVVH